MFKRYKSKIRQFFCELFSNENREKGLVQGLAIWAIVSGITTWFVSNNLGWIARNIVTAATALLLNISKYFIENAARLLNQVAATDFVKESIINSNVTQHGWMIVRDFANMFVVLGFVVVGLATILRIQEYQAGKTLLPLIIVAILINFSMVICGVFIDASNITMAYFLNSGNTSEALTQPFIDASQDPNTAIQLSIYRNQDNELGPYITIVAAQTVSNGLAAMIFFMFAILFLLRHVALICLVMLSPLAIAAYALPKTRASIFQKWAEQFTQWLIIGIPSAFFMYIAAHVMTFEYAAKSPNLNNLSYWVPLGFLMAAYTFCFQTSAMGAGAAMGLATGAVGMAWGATKGVTGRAAKWAGAKAGKRIMETDAAQKMTTGVGRAMEALGLRTAGKTTANQAGLSAKKEVDLKHASTNQLADYANSRGIAGRLAKGREQAAAAKLLAEKGEFDLVGQHITNPAGKIKYQTQAVENAKRFGYDASDTFYKADPALAGHDQDLISQIQKRSPALTPAAAGDIAVKEATQRLKHDDILKLNTGTLKNYNVVKHMTAGQVTALEKGLTEQKNAIRAHMAQVNADALAAAQANNNSEFTRLCNLYARLDALT